MAYVYRTGVFVSAEELEAIRNADTELNSGRAVIAQIVNSHGVSPVGAVVDLATGEIMAPESSGRYVMDHGLPWLFELDDVFLPEYLND